MKKVFSIIVALVATSFMTGCATQHGQSTTQLANNFIHRQSVEMMTKQPYPAKNPQAIALYDTKKSPHAAYRIIGVAKISKYNMLGVIRQEKTMHEMLKKLAASIGGDGIMNVKHNNDAMQANVIAFQKILI